MHAILVSLGRDGDVYPFVALAIALHSRGHRVTLVANEHYEAFALDHGATVFLERQYAFLAELAQR